MAEHGIIGDSYGTELPETQVPEQDLMNEKKMAKFSRTAEFAKLKEHLLSRIEHYKAFLPDGTHVAFSTEGELAALGQRWVIANAIIAEFQAVILAYENARQTIEEANR